MSTLPDASWDQVGKLQLGPSFRWDERENAELCCCEAFLFDATI